MNLAPFTIAWWETVIEHPEDNKITVFRKGTFHGSKIVKNAGGHTLPIA